jgi:cytochrome b561
MSDQQKGMQKYDSGAIVLHWLMALLVIGQFIFGLQLDAWPNTTKLYYVNLHFMVGFCILGFLLLRLYWRRAHTPPDLPADVDLLSRKLSTPVHWLMYVALLALPASGLIAAIWHARIFNFGLFTLNFGVANNRAVYPMWEDIHGYLAKGLIIVVIGHALAALWHHFIRKDGVFLRMWPSRFSS